MGIHTTDAIVLRHWPYRETSALVSCLTDRFGKLRGLIKGLRGPQSRHRSPMEPLTLNRIVFYDTRSSALHLVTQCELLDALPALQADLEIARLAATCAELTDVVTEPDEPQPEIFALLKRTLERLAGEAAWDLQAVRTHFILRLLRLAGFQPQLDECVGCMQRLAGTGYWSPKQGGLLCERCLHQDPKADPMPASWFEALSAVAEADDPARVDPRQAASMQPHLNEFLTWRLDRPLKTLRMAYVNK